MCTLFKTIYVGLVRHISIFQNSHIVFMNINESSLGAHQSAKQSFHGAENMVVTDKTMLMLVQDIVAVVRVSQKDTNH